METTTRTVSELIKSGESPLSLDVIPNHMGINLCSVEAITWTKQDDNQLVSLTIHFIPASEEEKKRQRTMTDTNGEGGIDRYIQLKVAVQDMLIELRIFPEDLQRRVSPVMDVSDKESVAKLSVKVCQKLIDAGVLDGTQETGYEEMEVLRWTGDNWSKIYHFIHSKPSNMLHHAAAPDGTIKIETLKGTMTAKKGDWIAKNSQGEIFLNPNSTAILVASKHLDGSPPVPPMPPTSEIIKESRDKPEGQ